MERLIPTSPITPAQRTSEASRNLLIIHTPGQEDLSDWLEVKRRIEEQAPDIDVRIGTNGARNSMTRRWQVTRPSLVFCTCRLVDYEPKGGTVYAARAIEKFEQIERLARHGLPVPRTARLVRDMVLDPAQWGPYVVAKPQRGFKGQAVRLVRTVDVAARYAELTAGGSRDMLLQPYIEHTADGYPTEYRVLILFGRALYCARNRWGARRPALEDIASDPNGIIASNDRTFGRVRTVCNDPEIVTLGEQAHPAFPECALLGVDIIRETATGELYVMEINGEGTIWHLSSSLAKTSFTAEHVRDLYQQFDALDRTARLLIEKTRSEAS